MLKLARLPKLLRGRLGLVRTEVERAELMPDPRLRGEITRKTVSIIMLEPDGATFSHDDQALLAACSPAGEARQDPATASIAPGTHLGTGRDALCVAGEGGAKRGGFIAFGAGDSNCSASGRIDAAGGTLALIPAGDAECRIPLKVEGERILIGQPSAACAYYCGPGAILNGKSFAATVSSKPATDFGGSPLC